MKKNVTVEDHTNNKTVLVLELFEKLRYKIKQLYGVQERPTAPYIGYYFVAPNRKDKLFIEVHLQQTRIVLHLRPLEYNNSKLVVTKVADSHKWTLDRLVNVYSETDLNTAMNLIEQSYEDVFVINV